MLLSQVVKSESTNFLASWGQQQQAEEKPKHSILILYQVAIGMFLSDTYQVRYYLYWAMTSASPNAI